MGTSACIGYIWTGYHFAINARAYALMMLEYLKRYLRRNAKSGRIVNLSTYAAYATQPTSVTLPANMPSNPIVSPRHRNGQVRNWGIFYDKVQ